MEPTMDKPSKAKQNKIKSIKAIKEVMPEKEKVNEVFEAEITATKRVVRVGKAKKDQVIDEKPSEEIVDKTEDEQKERGGRGRRTEPVSSQQLPDQEQGGRRTRNASGTT